MLRRAALTALTLLAAATPARAEAAVPFVQVGVVDRPTAIAAAPGDPERLYVAQQGGQLVVIRDGRTSTFLDLAGRLSSGGERGLLGVAFAPDFATSRRVYLDHTAPNGDVVVARVLARDGDSADPASYTELVRIPHDQQGNHNGGQLAFGPDGLLYVGVGDGGGGGDPARNGQYVGTGEPLVVNGANHDNRLGKLLRLDVSGDRAQGAAGNAFPDAPLVWARGLRNPWRFSFDRATGDLVVADVGQSAWEEATLLPAGTPSGRDLGWNLFEGTHPYAGGSPSRDGLTFPQLEHSHDDGWCSITGGVVVRDASVPELDGRYVYGDYCKGEIWSARLSAGGAAEDGRVAGLPSVPQISTFGEDVCGRPYVASLSGAVHRLSDAPCPPEIAQTTPSAGPGSSPADPADASPPAVAFGTVRAQRALRTNRLFVPVRCSERCTVRAAVALGGRTLRSPAADQVAGVRATQVLRLTRAARRALARRLRGRRSTLLRVAVTARDPAGNAASRTLRLRVRR